MFSINLELIVKTVTHSWGVGAGPVLLPCYAVRYTYNIDCGFLINVWARPKNYSRIRARVVSQYIYIYIYLV